MRKFFFVATLLLYSSGLYSQKIWGVVSNDTSKVVLEYAVISLLNASDSSQLNVMTTNASGAYKFSNVKRGEYLIQVSFVGYKAFTSELLVFKNDSSSLQLNIALTEDVATTQSVKIVATKSAIKQEAGKTTVDVKNMSSAAGLMAIDLLRRMPGVLIDNNDNITLKGRGNVTIQLDGRTTYMSTKQIAQILKSMPASEIDNIEIISVPSAKYDAQGAGGIININLKKTAKKGFYGNLTGSYGQGFYGKRNAGVNLSYNTGKWRLNGNFNLTSNENRSISNNFRTFGNPDSAKLYDQKAIFHSLNNSQSYSIDAAYNVNDKLSIGFAHRGVFWGGFWNSTDGGSILNEQMQRLVNNETDSKSNYKGYVITNSTDFKYKLDSTGNFSGSTGVSFNDESGSASSAIIRNANATLDTAVYSSNLPSDSYNVWANVDFEKKLKKKLSLEAGLKYVYSFNQYDYAYGVQQKVLVIPAVPTSVLFDFTEHLAAAYAQAAWNEAKWGVKTGLRSEYWNALGEDKLASTSFTRNFLQFFPSAAVNYNISDKHGLSLAYNKRIRRPHGEMLAPVSYFSDPYSLFSGNPKVLPSIIHNTELSHTFKDGLLVTTLGYARATNVIQEYAVSQRDSSNILDMTTINIPLQESWTFSMSFYKVLNKWWTLQLFGIVMDNRLAGYLSNLKTTVDNSYITANFNTTSTFTLPKKWLVELSAFYQMKHLAGYTINKDLGSLGLAVKKEIIGGRGSLKLNCQDIFHTMRYTGTSDVNGFKREYLYSWDNQVVYLSFNWKLGSKWFMNK